ncbi:CHAT domain-containing protein [Pseudonocardia oroxyli]|uniref:CHAT domain-containing protein n=1 Tax=Pseudonocardia oroxyli TaxID=366584 RepID=A0A1G7UTQ9_PSEOR|nr:CHAT domain-containing protein [Pseudonocardia oroxyli]
MNQDVSTDLVIRAVALHADVVADPRSAGPAVPALVAEARRAAVAREALVVALRAQAAYERSRTAHDSAKRLLDEAVRLARAAGLAERLHEVLVSRAVVQLERGRFAPAARDLDAAAQAAPGGDTELELQRASVLYNVGRLPDAARICRRVLADPRTTRETEAKVANNLAMIEAQLGRPEVALGLLDRADALAGPALGALVACSRGWVLARAGRLADSLRAFDAAEQRYRAVGLAEGELHLEQLDTFLDLRLTAEARTSARRAQESFAAGGAGLMGAEALLRLAHVEARGRDPEAALAPAAAATAAFRAQRRPAWVARAEIVRVTALLAVGRVEPVDLAAARRAVRTLAANGQRAALVDGHLAAGRAALALSRRPVARAHLAAALTEGRRGSVLVRAQARLAGALAAHTEGDDAGVVRHARGGLLDLNRHRDTLGSTELRALASGHGVELGRLGLRALLRSAPPADVLRWLDRIRAAALLTSAPPLEEEVRAPRAALAAVQAELAQLRRDGAAEPATLLAEQATLEVRVRKAAWRSRAAEPGRGGTASLSEVRRLLAGRPLVAYGTDGGRVFAVVVRPRRTELVGLGARADVAVEAEALGAALRRLGRPGRPSRSAPAAARHAVGRLRELLVAPLGLDPQAPVVVVPDPTTREVPWSALHPGPVSAAPSMSLWARTAGTPAAGGRTVLVAGPGLPGAVEEVTRLHGLHPDADVLVPPVASVAAVTATLAGAELAHLACHGLVRADNPIFSAVRLADGDMTVHRLDLLGAAPRRTVLAVCESAAGVPVEGDEVLGLVGALMARGAAAVAASIAPIGDAVTVGFSLDLHRALARGATMADAVHAARAAVDVEDPHGLVLHTAFTAFGAA